ncbi:MAG TPA: response regulator [Methylobacterium sp.]|jgi:CheY-like chemotaxis protein
MKLAKQRVLLVEDEMLTAIDVTCEVEDAGGHPVGPATSVREALSLIETEAVTGAILDVNVRDGETTRVAAALIERRIPFVIHTGAVLPPRLRAQFGAAPVLIKPTTSPRLIAALACEIENAQASAATARTGAAHALVIEDERHIAEILDGCLRASGYDSVDQADTEAGAIEAARAHRPDLVVVVVDVRLREGDGLAAARAIRIAYGVPLVVVTARPDLARDIDARFVVTKPFTPAILRAAIERARPTGLRA